MFPNFIDNARVIEYTDKLNFGTFSNTIIYYLAICKYDNDNRLYLFLLDGGKEVVNDFLFDSLEDIKNSCIILNNAVTLKEIVWYKQ